LMVPSSLHAAATVATSIKLRREMLKRMAGTS
jgi:hypothetical protein